MIQCGTKSNGHAKKNLNGTDAYTGDALKKKSGKVHPTADAAIKASAWNIPGAILSAVWTYPGGTFKTARFDTPGDKHIRPVHLADGGWKVGDPPGKLPLYRFDEIPADAKNVVVCEGEKCTDLFFSIGILATTSSHGSGSADRSDWNPLADLGAVIVFVPDNDPTGEKYVADACRIIFQRNQNAKIKIIRLPNLPPGGDIEQFIDARDSMETEAIAGSIFALADDVPFIGASDVPDAMLELSAVSVASLLKDFPQMRPPLIDGVLRMTETMNMIDAAKGGITHTAIDLGLSVSTGRAWLGRYAIANAGPVLYIDAELHQNTMSRRIASICTARGILSDEIAGKLDVLSLRGRLRDIFGLRIWLADHAGGGRYKLIVFDALYRLIPEGIDENSNSDMTRVFNAVDQIAEVTGAACLIIHHASKGVQAGKSIVDVGSGASAMARATDSHIIFRQHTEDGCKVMEMAGRSWPPLSAVAMRWEYPVWNIDDTLDPTDLRESNRRKRQEKKADDSTPAGSPEPWTPERFAQTFASDIDQAKALIAAKARQAGIATRTVDDMIRLGISTGLLYRWTRPKSNEVRLATIPQPVTETGAANGQ